MRKWVGELIAGTRKRLTVSISSAKPINRLSFAIKLKINLKEEEEEEGSKNKSCE